MGFRTGIHIATAGVHLGREIEPAAAASLVVVGTV
jgi:hypothetical protein